MCIKSIEVWVYNDNLPSRRNEARITVFKEHSNQIFPETSSTFLARGNQGIRKRNRKPLLYLAIRERERKKRMRE